MTSSGRPVNGRLSDLLCEGFRWTAHVDVYDRQKYIRKRSTTLGEPAALRPECHCRRGLCSLLTGHLVGGRPAPGTRQAGDFGAAQAQVTKVTR